VTNSDDSASLDVTIYPVALMKIVWFGNLESSDLFIVPEQDQREKPNINTPTIADVKLIWRCVPDDSEW